MKLTERWEYMDREQRKKVIMVAAAVVLGLGAVVGIVWNLSLMLSQSGTITHKPEGEVAEFFNKLNEDMAFLRSLDTGSLKMEIAKREEAFKAALKAEDPAQIAATGNAVEYAKDELATRADK